MIMELGEYKAVLAIFVVGIERHVKLFPKRRFAPKANSQNPV